jgi:hypothetical protein
MTTSTKDPHQWCRVGDVVVSFTGPGEINDLLWGRYVEALAADGVRVALAMTADDAAGLSATQRKVASDALQTRGRSAVAVTNSRITRGVITAASWLGVKVRGFSWDQLEEAIRYTAEDSEVQQQLRALAAHYRDIDVS